jgi:hypothetical protein
MGVVAIGVAGTSVTLVSVVGLVVGSWMGRSKSVIAWSPPGA